MHARGNGPFKVLEPIGDNAYKLNLPGEYQASATFNVAGLSLFDEGLNSRTNSFQEEGDGRSMGKDGAIEALRRSSSRSQVKEMQAKVVGLQLEIKKILIMEEKPKNEFKNCEKEWAKCYTYFMIQVQAQEEEDWVPHGAQKSLNSSPHGAEISTHERN